jgi:hypothetical protein
MEENLLEVMIRDRETQIALITRKMEEQSKKLERVVSDLDEIKGKQTKDTVDQQVEVDNLIQRRRTLLQQYKEATEVLDMKKQQQGAQLHIYNEVMKSVATPESRDSSYVMRMQAQLCKAMHSMGMMETQLAMVHSQVEGTQKDMKDTVTGMVEEKSQVELRLMNDLVVTDNARREVETKNKGMAESFTKEKDALLERIDQQQEDPPEEDDDEEKEELMEILTQGREEIERIEGENKAAAEKLEKLKIQVAEVRGEAFVEDVVTSIAEEFKERENAENSEEEE